MDGQEIAVKENNPDPEDEADQAPEPSQVAKAEPESMPEAKPKRKITEKQIKLGVFVVVIIVVGVILLWGMVPEEIYEVHQITNDPGKYDGKEISVKGIVADWNVTDEFTLVDESNNSTFILANHTAAFPDGFSNGAVVVLKGTFKIVDGEYTIESWGMQIGCPSKY